MRMTNKIMRNNSLYNINQTKIMEDKLTNQMTNQSKIVRPSDDPVVAIRALRLRSNVTSVTQYHDKNAADADQWLTVTADALATIDSVLKNLYEQATGAANKYETSEDLSIILEQMKSLTKEFYASGNVDYAGRYVFSGFRTDTAITFSAEDIAQMKKHPVSYNLTESIGYESISTINYTDFSVLDKGLPAGAAATESYEQYVTNTTMYRFRLAYNDIDSKDENGNQKLPTLTHNGTALTNITSYATAEEAYKAVADGTEQGIAFVANTGELVFSKDFYEKQFKEGDKFEVNYDKSNWKEGDRGATSIPYTTSPARRRRKTASRSSTIR